MAGGEGKAAEGKVVEGTERGEVLLWPVSPRSRR